MIRASGTIRGSAIMNPSTSVQFSYSLACTARAMMDPVMSDPPREKVRMDPSGMAP